MNAEIIIQKTVEFVKHQLVDAESGHDWFHIERVWKLSKQIAQTEEVNMFVVELGALLHDIADPKFHNGDETIGPLTARTFLESIHVDEGVIEHVIQIINNISFKVQFDGQRFKSPELDVIQDADRLEAIGAIGIARAFNYGGFKNRIIYDPAIAPNLQQSKEAYKNSTAPTINHFYEKLLLLKDKMNTKTGKIMAEQRHAFMLQYLEQFYAEWEGKR
jgi:uncharacterized protein